jgi:hypothetical protein
MEYIFFKVHDVQDIYPYIDVSRLSIGVLHGKPNSIRVYQILAPSGT